MEKIVEYDKCYVRWMQMTVQGNLVTVMNCVLDDISARMKVINGRRKWKVLSLLKLLDR